MSIFEPLPQATTRGHNAESTKRRWRAWYSNIADEQLRDPKATIAQIAERLNRSPGTIGAIVASDTYRDYFARRRQEFSQRHDFAIIHGLQRAATAAITGLADRLEDPTQIARVKTTDLADTAASVLDRLGFAPKPVASVNVNVNNGNQVVVPALTREALESARSKLRAVEAAKLIEPLSPRVSGSANALPNASPQDLPNALPSGEALPQALPRPEASSAGAAPAFAPVDDGLEGNRCSENEVLEGELLDPALRLSDI